MARREGGQAGARVRSFLVADIRGYTSYTAAHGDEAAAALVKHFAEIVSDGVVAWSGTLVELRGDEALASFESPRSALRAAVELQAALADESRDKPDQTLNIGIGLDAGEAVPVGDGFRGAALNRAARLCSAAEAGQTLASEELIHLAGPVSGIDFAPPHEVTAKGLDEPLGVVAVTATRATLGTPGPAMTLAPPTPIPPQLDPIVPLAGRQHELAWLRWHWRRARHGDARCVVVSGIPGIGKTRLAAALAAIAHEDGAPVTYLPRATDIAQAVLATKAHGRPALLVVDDIDAAPGDLVKVTVDEATTLDGPVLLLVTHRTEASAELLRSLESLTPPSMRRELGPLDLEAVRMIASLYAGDEVDQLPLAEIVEETDGHPASVHRVAHEWARRLAIQRVGSSAGRAETGRRDLQNAEAALIADISLLERAREGALLYDDRPDLSGDTDEPRSRPRSMCPYKGLEPYDTSDADLFFGRERLVAELTARLVGSPFLAIVGASGSGKSSVIRAGLLPALAAGALPGSDAWAQVSMRPGDRPMSALRQALCRRFEDLCAEQPAAGELIDKALAALPQGGRLVLSIDQFEEVFACRDAAERSAFIDTLCGEHPGLLVIVALRADHYGHAAAYPALARLLASHHVLVGTLTRGELVAVIERPADRVGLRVEPELVDALVADAGAEPSVLPLLSTALLESWTLREGDRLTYATYQAGGGLHGSVARLAEGVWTALDPDRQAVVRAILLRLAGSDEAEGFVRRRVPLAEFDLDDEPMSADVLERLVSARLLTTEDDTVEVTHEALLREWPRLREWLEEDASGHQLHMHLTAAARAWDGSGRPTGDLYRGARLTAALDWSAEHAEQLNATEREFLAASQAATEQEVERQRKANRNLRVLVVGIGVFLIVAIGAGVFAALEANRAEEQRLAARASGLAASSISELDSDPSLSKLLAVEAARIKTRPDVITGLHTALAVDAVERRVRFPSTIGNDRGAWVDVDPSGRWAVMTGHALEPWPQMDIFDLSSDSSDPVWTFAAPPGALVSAPRFTPDGTRLVASVFHAGDTETQPPRDALGVGVWRLPADDDADWPIEDWIDVGQCGARLHDVSDRDGLIEAWPDAASCEVTLLYEVGPLDLVSLDDHVVRRVGDLAIHNYRLHMLSSDGDTAVYFDLSVEPPRTVVVDTQTLVERTSPTGGDWPLGPVAINSDGSLLVTEGPPYEVWDVSTGERLATHPGHGPSSRGEFLPGTNLMVTGGTNATAALWDAASGETIGTYPAVGGLWPQSVGDRIGVVDVAEMSELVIIDPAARGEPLAVDLCADVENRNEFAVWSRSLDAIDGRLLTSLACDPEAGDVATTVVLDGSTGAAELAIDGHTGHEQAISPDGQRVARLDEQGDGRVAILDLASGEVMATMDAACWDGIAPDPEAGCGGEHIFMEFMDWSRDGRYLVGGGEPVVVWDTESGEVVSFIDVDQDLLDAGLWDAGFSPDSERLIVSRSEGRDSPTPKSWIDVYSTETWELLQEVEIDTETFPWISIAGWSPDGSTLFARGGGGWLGGDQPLLWLDGETFEKLGSGVKSHDAATEDDALSPDGTRLATASTSGEIRIWNLADRTLVHEIQLGDILQNQQPAGITWTDDARIMVVTQQGMLVEFTTDTDELIGLVADSLTRGFTDDECARYEIDPCPTIEEMREG